MAWLDGILAGLEPAGAMTGFSGVSGVPGVLGCFLAGCDSCDASSDMFELGKFACELRSGRGSGATLASDDSWPATPANAMQDSAGHRRM